MLPLLFLLACDPGEAPRTLTLAGYTTPREVYEQTIIPSFTESWKESTGEDVEVRTSWSGSGSQSRAVVAGFEADVVALSLEPDVRRIAEAGLITHDWKAHLAGGMVTSSIAVLAVRPGNPKGITGWDDLRREDVEVLTPNPRTSGGAMWNASAIYGACLRGHTAAPAGDPEAAEAYLAQVLSRVTVLDKGARESMISFDKGVGDVAITYENEVVAARLAGRPYELVAPSSTILIENPVAVVDASVELHGNRDLAEAFVDSLCTAESQAAFSEHGYRPMCGGSADWAAEVADLFTVRDLGDWTALTETLFAPGATWDRAQDRARAGD